MYLISKPIVYYYYCFTLCIPGAFSELTHHIAPPMMTTFFFVLGGVGVVGKD